MELRTQIKGRKKTISTGIIFMVIALMFTNAKIVAEVYDSAVTITGELKKWHKITLTFNGPATSETAENNPFMHYRLNVEFTHTTTGKIFLVPGYFAADGNAGETSASAGNKWKVHFSADEAGVWKYSVDFHTAPWIAVSESKVFGEGIVHHQAHSQEIKGINGLTGSIKIGETDKTGPDFRSKGRLNYVGERYLQFAETGEYFLRCGTDAPENLLSFADFDGTFHNDGHKDHFVKTWEAHLQDWKDGDPTWKGNKGKALIGAINYLESEGLNSMSFLTNNIMGDDQNVFPYIDYTTFDRFDVSKLDQWEVIFSHAQQKGIFLHFKTLESENQGMLDGGGLGAYRRLYYRELIARFGHHLALNWNMCEENGEWHKNLITPPQFTHQRLAMADYFHNHDPYNHHVVIHNGVEFDDILTESSKYTGVSVQTDQEDFSRVHTRVLHWINESKKAGKNWAVACDEPGDHRYSLVPDEVDPDKKNARSNALWGTYLAGGWGVDWYFGYEHPHSDLTCQDFRSRDIFWDKCKIALDFFQSNKIAFWQMDNHNELIDNNNNSNDKFCMAELNNTYIIYLSNGITSNIDLTNATGKFDVHWFDPVDGGELQNTKQRQIKGGSVVTLKDAPSTNKTEWVILIQKAK